MLIRRGPLSDLVLLGSQQSGPLVLSIGRHAVDLECNSVSVGAGAHRVQGE